jgi:hypothetical protein
MRRRSARIRKATTGVATAGLLLGVVTVAAGGPAKADDPAALLDGIAAGVLPDMDHLEDTARFPLDAASIPETIEAWKNSPAGKAALAAQKQNAGATPAVGTVRPWLSLDRVLGKVYLKEYTLRGVGENIEVWVASGAGPDGVKGIDPLPTDCRLRIPNSFTITDGQVNHLISEYDKKMLPIESKAFSVAPARDGSKKSQDPLVKDLDFSGDGNKVVTLVDNVRDENFYDFPKFQTYIAGFFSRQFNELTDRNIMTIDGYDWAHRTGGNPKDEPNPDDICVSRPARPWSYEGIFAHEYQHLLQYYVDEGEVNFINEGLSDYAISITGYSSTEHTVFDKDPDAHIYCFQGFGTVQTKSNPNARPCGGPQNSLTLWGDEGQNNEILADYGNAWSFLLFMRDRYGDRMIEAIHQDKDRQGLKSVQHALDTYAKGVKVADVLHDFQLMTLVDKIAGAKGSKVTGVRKDVVSTKSLTSTVNLLNPAAYTAVGAAPNGADFVPLRVGGVGYATGADLKSLVFAGRKSLPPVPLKWVVAPQGPALPTLSFPQYPNVPPIDDIPPPELPPSPLDNPALFGGNAGNIDATAVFRTTVPTDNPTLSFTSVYNLEENFDYGFVVISTDGGKTYKTLANANTRETVKPAPAGVGFTGTSPLPLQQTFDLKDYAGKSVILGFRFLSDPLVNQGGWYIDDIKVGNELISDGTSVAPFKSYSQMRPVQVQNWSLQVVGLDEKGKRVHVERFNGKFGVTLTPAQIKRFASFPLVVAIVSFDDPTETVPIYAPYSLRVNGIGQTGGSN